MKLIVISNTKGGVGKSTFTINVALGLSVKHRVLILDADSPQFTVTKFFDTRKRKHGDYSIATTSGNIFVSPESFKTLMPLIETRDTNLQFQHYDYVIVDTGGYFSDDLQKLHAYADIIVTPIGDSALEFDVLKSYKKFGEYSNLIWNARKECLSTNKTPFKWYVALSRISSRSTKNQVEIIKKLKKLQKQLDFELLDGLKDRLIYKELYDEGLNVFDLSEGKLTVSSLTAKLELRILCKQIIA